MASLLKSFGKGCLYILVLPVLIVILAVYAVLGVVMFLFILIRAGILFFTGRNFGELEEDIKARAIIEGNNKSEAIIEEKSSVEIEPTSDYADHYYMPINQDIPTPAPLEPVEDNHKEADTLSKEEKDGGESL